MSHGTCFKKEMGFHLTKSLNLSFYRIELSLYYFLNFEESFSAVDLKVNLNVFSVELLLSEVKW